MTARVLVGLAAWAVLGCGSVRKTDFEPVCPTYATAVQPILDKSCVRCHASSDGTGYDLRSYREVVRPSLTDVQRVVAGSADSPLLQAARGELASHQAVSAEEVNTLELWVVQCNAAPSPTEYHPVGWGSPVSKETFHGAALRSHAYNTVECQKCHGQDLRGGKARVDCNSCHEKGPFSCGTCHGSDDSPAPPKALDRSRSPSNLGVGAHGSHLVDSPLRAKLECTNCHPKVTSAEDEGHYRFGSDFVADRPVVVLHSLDGGTAEWDRTTATCSNVACHEPNSKDAKATLSKPVWTNTNGDARKCGACHGLGPTGHQSTRCDACHTEGYADGGVDLSVHMNGVIDFGPLNRCNACHAGPGSTAFYDTHGNADAGIQTVGAHTAHLVAGTLRGPLACGDCHAVPDKATAEHHADTPPPAEVFPSFWDGGTARLDGAAPSYDSTTATCSNVYCHGGGDRLSTRDHAPGIIHAPVWNGGHDQAKCGTCHGTPPQDGRIGHSIASCLETCAQCHGLSVQSDGGIRFYELPDGGIATHHMDGVVNGNF